MKISVNTEAINSKWFVSQAKELNNNTSSTKENRDSINISAQAHHLFSGMKKDNQSSIIEGLMKQRESLMEMKEKFAERTLDEGKDISSIQEQLKEFEKQIAELDAQIAKQQTEERNKILGNDKKENAKSSPKSEEEELLTKAVTLDEVKSLDRVSNNLERKKNTLESEMKLDASRGINIERKQDTLIKIEDRIQTIREQINEKNEQHLGKNQSIKNEEEMEEETLAAANEK